MIFRTQAVILLGGKGTRISRLFPDRPKALVPVAGKLFLDRQIAWLTRGGITDIHLAAGHRAGALRAWLAAQTSDLSLTFSTEPSPLGTGGGLKYVEDHIRSDPFIVLNGDTLMPQLDFTAFQQAHAQTHSLVSIAVTHIQHTSRYGTIEFDPDRQIRAFHEKRERREGWVNGGAYLMDRKVFAVIEAGRNVSLETEVFPRLAAQGQLCAYPVPPPLLDMGTPEGLAAMENYFLKPIWLPPVSAEGGSA